MNRFSKILFSGFLFFSLFLTYSASGQGLEKEELNLNEFVFRYEVLIYPNPVIDNKFYVKSEETIKSVEIMNVVGQKIKTIYNRTNVPYNIYVELDKVNKGMYMVRVTFEDGKSILRKIILK